MESVLEAEIRRLLKTVVREVAQELRSENNFSGGRQTPNVEPDERFLLRSHEAAERLGISQGHLSRLTRSGVLPCVRVGRLVHYSTETIRQWIQETESTETPARTPKQKPLQKVATPPKSKRKTSKSKSSKSAKNSAPKKTTRKEPKTATQAKSKKPPSVRRKPKAVESEPDRISPFSLLLAELGVDPDAFPGITNGEIRAIAGVDIPTLHGWSYQNRKLPEEALQRLRDHFGKFANKSNNGD